MILSGEVQTPPVAGFRRNDDFSILEGVIYVACDSAMSGHFDTESPAADGLFRDLRHNYLLYSCGMFCAALTAN